MKKLILVLTGFSLAVSIIASAQTLPTSLPDFSADVHMVNKGQTFSQGKIYMSQAGVRMDISTGGMAMTNIQRVDKGIMYMMMPNKTYMEQPLPYNPMTHHEVPAGWTQNCSSGEAIDNHPTDKCILTGQLGGQNVSTAIWKAKDLNGVVIRVLGDSGPGQGAGMELKNVVLATQPASLFEIPADYHKMELPPAAAQMMKKMQEKVKQP